MKRFSWLPRLSRRARIVRNFLLALLLLAAVVLALGVPPLTKYGVFRRLEEQYLLTPSQLVYRMDKIVSAVYVTQGDGWITVGKVDTLDVGGTPFFHHFGVITHVLPRDSMQVVILPESTEDGSTVIALWGAPEEAAAGEIALTLEEIEPWSDILEWTVPEREVFSAQTVREGDWFFFELPPHQDHPDSEWCIMDALWDNVSFSQGAGSWPYRLTLRDAKGDVVWTGSGDTAEGNAGLRART